MANSYVYYDGDGLETDFSVPFGYIETSEVLAEVDGSPATFTWLDSGTIRFDSTPPSGTDNVYIYRDTDDTAPKANFNPGQVRHTNLNKISKQWLYVLQEYLEREALEPQTAAEAAQALAEAAQSAAEVAQTAAEAAQSAAETAQSAAETAQTGAETAETNAASSASAASSSASAAATSESNAATSESNAATSESNAATSESNAASSASAASTSETNAAASESAAGSAQTAAEAAQTAAENAADSINVGLSMAWSSTITMADPGSGNLRFNHSSVTSTTAIAIDDLTADAVDLSGYITTWGDSDSTVKGHLVIQKEGSPSVFAIYAVTGLTDNAGWTQLTVSHVDSSGSFTDTDPIYVQFIRAGDKGTGDMNAATYDPTSVAGDAFHMDNMVEGTTTKIMTNTERTKLSGIEANADVTDSTNVDAAGATMNSDTDVSGNGWVIDEDNMASDSDQKVPTQQSVKAHVSAQIATREAADVDILKADTADTLEAGFGTTPYNFGTKSTGSFQPDVANGNFQYGTNGGAHTLSAPADDCSMCLQYTNNGSAGAITKSGFDIDEGDSLTTANGAVFLMYITVINGSAHIVTKQVS